MAKPTVCPNDGESQESQRPTTEFGADERLMHEATTTLIGQGADKWHFAQLAHNAGLCREVIELIEQSQKWINVIGEPIELPEMLTFHPFDAFDGDNRMVNFSLFDDELRRLIYNRYQLSKGAVFVAASTVQVRRLRISARVADVLGKLNGVRGVRVEAGHVWSMLKEQGWGQRGILQLDGPNVFFLDGLKPGTVVPMHCTFSYRKSAWDLGMTTEWLRAGSQIITPYDPNNAT